MSDSRDLERELLDSQSVVLQLLVRVEELEAMLRTSRATCGALQKQMLMEAKRPRRRKGSPRKLAVLPSTPAEKMSAESYTTQP